MAGTTVKTHSFVGSEGSILRELVKQVNKLIDDVELLRGVLATHTHTGANPVVPTAATIATVDTAAELLAAKIGNADGTAITA